MKSKRIILTAILAGLSVNAFAWASLGHATVAKIAEDHLTPEAKAACRECLDGLSIIAVASDADICRGIWTYELDFVPVNVKAVHPKWVKEFDQSLPGNVTILSHTFYADADCHPIMNRNFDGVYKGSCLFHIQECTKQLKEGWKTMDPKERKKILSILVHMVGDMHCPDHVNYDRDPSEQGSSTNFFFMDKNHKTTRHSFWDGGYLGHVAPWSFSDLAYLVDTYSDEYIKEITAGSVVDWAYDSALCCKVTHEIKSGEMVHRSYAVAKRPLVFSQLANAGYRLAALLNDIFK